MTSKVLVGQAQILQQDAGAISTEATAVEPDIEQPIVLEWRLLGGTSEEMRSVLRGEMW